MKLIFWIFATFIAIIFWQPLTALCKMWTEGKYENTEGITKVKSRKSKRRNDFVASRGELVEVIFEATFEPIIQGYIMLPNTVNLLERLSSSIQLDLTTKDFKIDFEVSGVEMLQVFSISTSLFSLAFFGFCEYSNVRKNMYMDPDKSLFTRFVVGLFMIFAILARLFSFMIFSLYWGPGNIYPLMIFLVIHIIISAIFHVLFSEDMFYWRHGQYGKFFHNILMNATACVYFHNYIRFEEEDLICHENCATCKEKDNNYKSGSHISTYLRQVVFEYLYLLELIILLSIGFSAPVSVTEHFQKPFLLSIFAFYLLHYIIKILYYGVMHIWSSHIVYEKFNLMERYGNISDKEELISYVLIYKNTWICGNLIDFEHKLPTLLVNTVKKIVKSIKIGVNQNIKQLLESKSINVFLNLLNFICGITYFSIGIGILSIDFNHGFPILSFAIVLMIFGYLLMFVDIQEKRNGILVYFLWIALSVCIITLVIHIGLILIQPSEDLTKHHYNLYALAISIIVTSVFVFIVWKVGNEWSALRNIGYTNDFFKILMSIIILVLLIVMLMFLSPLTLLITLVYVLRNHRLKSFNLTTIELVII